MNTNNKRTLGFIFLLLGGFFLLKETHLVSVIFFDGWWTLFLIVPAAVHLAKNGIQTGNLIVLAVGVFFLLDAQGINLSGYLLPILFVVLGIGLIFRNR